MWLQLVLPWGGIPDQFLAFAAGLAQSVQDKVAFYLRFGGLNSCYCAPYNTNRLLLTYILTYLLQTPEKCLLHSRVRKSGQLQHSRYTEEILYSS